MGNNTPSLAVSALQRVRLLLLLYLLPALHYNREINLSVCLVCGSGPRICIGRKYFSFRSIYSPPVQKRTLADGGKNIFYK